MEPKSYVFEAIVVSMAGLGVLRLNSAASLLGGLKAVYRGFIEGGTSILKLLAWCIAGYFPTPGDDNDRFPTTSPFRDGLRISSAEHGSSWVYRRQKGRAVSVLSRSIARPLP